MARCEYGYHGLCSACGGAVNRTKQHDHHWTPRNGGQRSILCEHCCGLTFGAAEVLLRCIDTYRQQTKDDASLSELIAQERLTIAIQKRLI